MGAHYRLILRIQEYRKIKKYYKNRHNLIFQQQYPENFSKNRFCLHQRMYTQDFTCWGCWVSNFYMCKNNITIINCGTTLVSNFYIDVKITSQSSLWKHLIWYWSRYLFYELGFFFNWMWCKVGTLVVLCYLFDVLICYNLSKYSYRPDIFREFLAA